MTRGRPDTLEETRERMTATHAARATGRSDERLFRRGVLRVMAAALGPVVFHGCASAGMGRGPALGTRAELRHAIDSLVALPLVSKEDWWFLIVDPERGDDQRAVLAR